MNLFWIRNTNLRTEYNEIFELAKEDIMIPIFIFHKKKIMTRSDEWERASVEQLQKKIKRLYIFEENPEEVILGLVEKYKIKKIFFSSSTCPQQRKIDRKIEEKLLKKNLSVIKNYSDLLIEPNKILTKKGTPYKLFAPFKKEALKQIQTAPMEKSMLSARIAIVDENTTVHGVKKNETENLCVGEDCGRKKLDVFLKNKLKSYGQNRDEFSKETTSKLSVHLRFGELSSTFIWTKCFREDHSKPFLNELLWREFAHYQRLHFPKITTENLKENKNIVWKWDLASFSNWKTGQTGVPLIDASMKQLAQEGYIHNRLRMIVASYLVKNLKIHWTHGAKYFMHALYDGDEAINSFNWQWIAGTGFESMPPYRYFSPAAQNKRYDPTNKYVKKYL